MFILQLVGEVETLEFAESNIKGRTFVGRVEDRLLIEGVGRTILGLDHDVSDSTCVTGINFVLIIL